jgi:hypothetical protein
MWATYIFKIVIVINVRNTSKTDEYQIFSNQISYLSVLIILKK